MAVRINFIDGGGAPVQASIAGATQRGRAAAAFGGAITDTAATAFSVIEKAREVKETGDRMSFMANVDKQAADFNISLIGRSDYTNWPDEFKSLTEEWNQQADELNMSPAGRAKLQQQLLEANTQRSIQLSTTAALRDFEEGKARASNSYNFAAETGDAEAMRRAEGELSSFLSPAEMEKVKNDGNRIARNNALMRDAIQDPNKVQEFLESDEGKNLPPNDYFRLQNVVMDQKREQAYGATERFNNMRVEGKIRTPEQIDQYFPNASPALREEMKIDLQRKYTQAQLAARKTPEYEAFVTGEVSSMLDDYQANMDDFDVSFYKMDTLVRTLPEGEAKARLNHRIDKVRQNQQEEWSESADEFRARFKDAFKSGAFGSNVTRQPIQQAIGDGLLSDRAKLIARGFSPEQAEIVAAGKADEGGLKAMGISEAQAKKLAEGTGLAGQIQLFRALDEKRQGFEDPSTDPMVRDAFDAVKTGNRGFIEWPSPAADQAVKQKYGTAIKEFEKFFRANPKASREELEKKFYSTLSPEGAKQFRNALIAPPPQDSDALPAAPDEASDSLLPPR